MKLRDLLKDTPRFSRTVPIGIETDISGEPALILGLAQVKDPWGGHPLNQIFVLRQMEMWDNEEDWDDESETPESTNRQFLIEEMKDDQDPSLAEIETFIINGQEFPVEESEDNFLSEENHFLVLLLRYFEQQGSIPPDWLGKDIDSLILTQHTMAAEIYRVNWDADILRIQVDLEKIPEAIFVGKVIQCPCGHYDKPKQFSFKGKGGKTHQVLIHALTLYNPWESIEDEEILSDLEDFLNGEDRLLVVEYETAEDLQLQFYMKEYLDDLVDEDWPFSDMALPGRPGTPTRGCALTMVPADFDEEVEIELLSYYESNE